MSLKAILHNLPEVKKPSEKKLSFNVKLKWTLIILISFFILSNIAIWGGTSEGLKRFEYLAVIMGTNFGSIISLGIGPIVMSSIILQLLAGSGILNIDQSTDEGKRFFQGLQKLGVLFFIVFEALIYVLMGGIAAMPGLQGIVIAQLIIGGLLIMFMDEVCQKWGFGSGVSLFIAAGVGWRLFSGLFGFLGPENTLSPIGAVPALIYNFLVINDVTGGLQSLAAIIATVLIFLIVVWAQSLKIEIPLSYDKLRGYGVKWPLSFFYASVIPVILTAALVANIQLFGGLIDTAAQPCYTGVVDACVGKAKIASYFAFLGRFIEGQPISGFAFWIGSTNIVDLIIKGGFTSIYLIQGIIHVLFFMLLSTVFAVFWVKTSGMDSKAQAKKIISSGLQISGFRQDERILESILDRYVMPLTVMGGLAIGFLAAITNLIGALVSGTAILLVIMIMYQLYQNIAQQHQMDMHPLMRKFVKN